jgi:glycosyltransferase involved in cell wall biosynthesis
MKVSVVICTYDEELYGHFREAVESIQNQTYDDIEIVLVVDGNDSLYERVERDYGDRPEVTTHCNDENLGLSGSRNRALEYVTGEVVAFIDDDAVADERWVEELVSVYEGQDVVAAGGKMTPIWVAGKPDFLPAEFYWLVGVTHRGFAEDGEEVRNTFGSNISFRTDILRELGGFETDVGRKGEKNLQAHETEVCARMRERYGRGVVYNADATVGHKVFAYRTSARWLFKRAFWQGYSKRAMEVIVSEDASAEESAFLKQLLFAFVPGRVKSLVTKPSLPKAVQFVTLFLLTGLVGMGYLYGLLKWR